MHLKSPFPNPVSMFGTRTGTVIVVSDTNQQFGEGSRQEGAEIE